jgi:L-aspartate oxidase
VIGGGIAGLSLALRVADLYEVTILTKGSIGESNSWLAQGGIASVVHQSDSIEAHIQDTLECGAGLCNPEAVRTIISMGPEVIQDLREWGVEFTRNEQGYDLGQEGGHSHRRILHVGDFTGKEVMEVLIRRARDHPRIQILENRMAVDLITYRRKMGFTLNDEVLGCYVLDLKTQKIEPWVSRYTILATGGSGKVYLYTSNPDVATGDGVAMAYRAGCRVVNMEFFQFHPTCLYHPQAKNFLISEAVRGEGGVLLNPRGERFMVKVHPLAELAPRDIVARAMDAEMKRTGAEYLYLDISFKPPEVLRSRFPHLVEEVKKYGYDLTQGPIPVVPAAHYQCGGVLTDLWGRTEIPRLYAIGEVAHTGLHGANRLASNSLLEGLVMAKRASSRILKEPLPLPQVDPSALQWEYGDAVPPEEEIIVAHNWEEVRRTMWSYVGIVRTRAWLERAIRRLQLLAEEVLQYYWQVVPSQGLLELRNLVQVAMLITRSALLRRESRGLHYILDYPEKLPRPQDTILDPISHYP